MAKKRVIRNAQPDLVAAEKAYANAIAPLGSAIIEATNALVLTRLSTIVGDPENPRSGWKARLNAALKKAIARAWRTYRPRRAAMAVSEARRRTDKLNEVNLLRQTRKTAKSKRARLGVSAGIRTADTTGDGEEWDEIQADMLAANVNKHASRVQKIVITGVVAGVAIAAIRNRATEVDGMTRRQMVNSAADQTQKFNSTLSETRWKHAKVNAYRWVTVGDDLVREEHEERNGQVFKWSNPPSDGHPGEPFMCRCEAQPIIGTFKATSAGPSEKEQTKVVAAFNRREIRLIENQVKTQVRARRVVA